VSKEKLAILEQIANAQAVVDAAEDIMNDNITLRRSLDMTISELINLNVDVSEIEAKLTEVNASISESAKNYASAKLSNEKIIIDLRSKMRSITDNIESPIDYNTTQIKKMPISSDSIKLNSQYFSYDENKQNSNNTMSSVKTFITQSFDSIFGIKEASEQAASAQSQISSQREHHDIEGTLIIACACTYKDAQLLAPFIINVDKAINAWNDIYPDKMIKMDDPKTIAQIAAEDSTKSAERLCILSGATYGSSFIGMVHVLKSSSTTSSQTMVTAANSMQGSMEVGGWFANSTGGLGVDSSFSDSVKNLLSSQNVQSHITMVVNGSIPSIKSNQFQYAVKQFTNFDPQAMGEALASMQGENAGEKDTVSSSATKAREGGKLVAMQSTRIKSVLSGVSDCDAQSNQLLDVNSLMTSFEDYVQKALDGNIGIPINFYLKSITRAQIAKMWVNKYYPGRFLNISGDDSQQGKQGGIAADSSEN
jgi:hypothetical protein